MAKHLLFWLTAAILLPLATRAQAYEPGWLVRSAGDTLRGEIENGFWVEPPAFIRFRRSASSPAELYRPRQLRAVGLVHGRYFRYEALPIDHAAQTQPDKLRPGIQQDIKIDSLLAEVLIEGPVSLLRVVSTSTTHYLLVHPPRPVLSLCARKYLRPNPNGTMGVVDGNNYVRQLALYFAQCPEAYQASQRAPFTGEGLAAVVQAYNAGCSPTRQVGNSWLAPPEAGRRRGAFRGGLLAGGRFRYLPDKNVAASSTECFDCRIRPFGGAYGEVFLPNRQIALSGELLLTTYRDRTFQQLPSTTRTPVYNVRTYEAWLASLRVGVRYFLPLPREQHLFVGSGYEIGRIVGTTLLAQTGPAVSSELVTDQWQLPSVYPYLAIGWRIKRLTISADGQMLGFFAGSEAVNGFSLRTGVSYQLWGRSGAAPRN